MAGWSGGLRSCTKGVQWVYMKKFGTGSLQLVTFILVLISLGLSIFGLLHNPNGAVKDTAIADPDATLKNIEAYLDSISPEYLTDIQALAKEDGLPSWGCGPASFSLAKILNKKFFDNKVAIYASYTNHPNEIVERFSFVHYNPLKMQGAGGSDHAWLEIYFGNKFLFVDPTIGQFGKYDKIMYEVFTVGDSTISDTLRQKYGIEDIRLKQLVQKAVNRIPTAQEPYPGMSLLPSTINYYLQVVKDRDTVDSGNTPKTWQRWVDTLTKKYN